MPMSQRPCQSRNRLLLYALFSVSFIPTSVIADERGITLEQAKKASLTNPKVLASRESVNQTRADARTAAQFPNPSLSLEVGMLPLSRRYTVDEPGGPTEFASGISYPIDWLLFGKRSATVTSAQWAVAIAEAEYTDVVRQRVAETERAFYAVLETKALLSVTEETLGDMKQARAAIEKAVAGGGRPRVELSRVLLELQSARREERSARDAVVSARAGLQALLGKTAEDGPLEVAGTLDAPISVKPLSAQAAFAIAANHRPDISALRAKVAKAREDGVVEGRNAFPETNLGIGVAHQFQRVIGAPDVTAWGAGIEVALPFFDRNQGNRAKAGSAALQADYELAAALTELRAEVEQTVHALRTALENATEVAQTELALAEQVRDSYRKAYEAGGRTLIEMLDAQQSYRETFRAYVTSRADYWRSLSQYQACLGKKVFP